MSIRGGSTDYLRARGFETGLDEETLAQRRRLRAQLEECRMTSRRSVSPSRNAASPADLGAAGKAQRPVGEMIDELTDAAYDLGRNANVRVVVLAGEGASFCAGGDLGWMRAQFDATRAERIAEARRLALLFKALNELPKPVIARVHGNAFGGGIGLLSVCDVAIAADTASFGLTETRLGLIPATISPYVVARIGEAKARPLFMSGKIIDAMASPCRRPAVPRRSRGRARRGHRVRNPPPPRRLAAGRRASEGTGPFSRHADHRRTHRPRHHTTGRYVGDGGSKGRARSILRAAGAELEIGCLREPIFLYRQLWKFFSAGHRQVT